MDAILGRIGIGTQGCISKRPAVAKRRTKLPERGRGRNQPRFPTDGRLQHAVLRLTEWRPSAYALPEACSPGRASGFSVHRDSIYARRQ